MTKFDPGNEASGPSSPLVMMSLARLARLAQEAAVLAPPPEEVDAPQVVRIRTSNHAGACAPLILVHPIGGSILPYRDLGMLLDAERDVYGIQSRADDARSSLLHPSIEALASDYVEQLSRLLSRGPLVLGGFSFGGTVAYEMARQMREQGRDVERVVLIDTPVRIRPLAQANHAGLDTAQLVFFGNMLAATAGRKLGLNVEDLDDLPIENRIRHLIDRLRELNVMGEDVDEGTYRSVYRLVQHNDLLQRTYAAGPYTGAVSLIRATVADALVRDEALDIYDETTFGWGAHCGEEIDVRYVPGSHLQLLYQPFIRGLATCMQLMLDDGGRGIPVNESRG